MVRSIRTSLVTALALGTAAVAGFTISESGGAAAASVPLSPVCPTEVPAVQVGDTGGTALEGAVVDKGGRLYVTDLFGGKILRFDTPGAAPKTIATLPNGGGALALLPDGTLIAGSGADPRVFLGDILKPGAIFKVDVDTGALTPLASGFSAADGLAVAHDGTIYATNDFGGQIAKISPAGVVTPEWAHFLSANGAVLSHDDKYLYESRTFWNPGVSRIPVTHPDQPQSLLDLQFPKTFDAPDGLTLDSQDRPVVPTDVGGYIFRIESNGKTCELAKGLSNSSVIVYGKGRTGFAAGHLYRAGFDGKVYEIPSGFDPAA